MDFTLIKSFVAVAEEGSFSSAAKHLFISQQSLSKQIARLEEELHTVLLLRSRPLHLTQDGKLFLQTAKEMLQLKQEFEDNSSKAQNAAVTVHLGIEHTIARAILPHILPKYLLEHPDTYVKISEESPEALEKAVSYEGVDLVIGSISTPPPSYKSVPLCKKQQLLVVPKQILRELAGDDYEKLRKEFSKNADLSRFESAPFIKLARNSSSGRSLSSYLKYYDIQPKFACELTNVENAFQLASSGVGVFIYAKLFWDMMPRKLQEDYLENIEIFPLPYLPELDKVCAYFKKDAKQQGSTPELLTLFSDFFADYQSGKLSAD